MRRSRRDSFREPTLSKFVEHMPLYRQQDELARSHS